MGTLDLFSVGLCVAFLVHSLRRYAVIATSGGERLANLFLVGLWGALLVGAIHQGLT